MQVEAGVGGVICHQGEPEDWQRVPREAAEVARLHDVEIGLWTGLYQVVDREQRSRRYLVAELSPGAWTGEFRWPIEVGSWALVRAGDREESWCVIADAESNPMRRCISKDGALGQALLGHRAGDVVCVQSREGSWQVTVVAVEP